jgi:hypothetical protein
MHLGGIRIPLTSRKIKCNFGAVSDLTHGALKAAREQNSMKIGVIGAGKVGGGLGKLWGFFDRGIASLQDVPGIAQKGLACRR